MTVTNISGNEITITEYIGKDDEVVIPSEIDGVLVTSIDIFAFSDNELTSIIIPDTVKTIGQGAFSDNELTSVTIPKGVTAIADHAFSSNELTSITIPDTVSTIGYHAFSSNQLTSVIIPDSVTVIGASAFNDNRLPDSQSHIYARNSDGTEDKSILVSYGGVDRDNVVISRNVITIGKHAFHGNGLTSITIPNSVTSIGQGAFSRNQLASITIPSSVMTIDSFAFSDNSSLRTIRVEKLQNSISGAPWGAENAIIEWK